MELKMLREMTDAGLVDMAIISPVADGYTVEIMMIGRVKYSLETQKRVVRKFFRLEACLRILQRAGITRVFMYLCDDIRDYQGELLS